jgi:hypothetical protein
MDKTRLKTTLAKIDAVLAQDPNLMEADGRSQPVALIHAQKRTAWVEKLSAAPLSEALQIAARAQHIRRWQMPRDRYPRTRTGYLQWRTALKQFHADTTAELMQTTGYDDATIRRVKALITKKRLKQDPDVQALEDALCLVFLETQFSEFAQKEADKIVGILQKTWKKMSPQGRQLALQLPLNEADRHLVESALAGLQT